MLLPTNSRLKDALQNICDADESSMKSLLNPESPQKLMYTLYIVDWLGRPARLRRHSGLNDGTSGLDLILFFVGKKIVFLKIALRCFI
jgi:hypothetical protein